MLLSLENCLESYYHKIFGEVKIIHVYLKIICLFFWLLIITLSYSQEGLLEDSPVDNKLHRVSNPIHKHCHSATVDLITRLATK